MVFLHGLKQGDELTNSQLGDVFTCAPQGGMRKSKESLGFSIEIKRWNQKFGN